MVDTTATPAVEDVPAFLSIWEQSTESEVFAFRADAGPLQVLTLHDFTFLGGKFKSESQVGHRGDAKGEIVADSRRTGKGVSAELKERLVKAQRRIYRSYAAEEQGQGRQPSEAGFRKWCGVSLLSGWQFRSKQHGRGGAVDVDAKYNPWIATRTNGVLGGEKHSELSDDEHKKIREAALSAFERAYQTHYGKEMPKEILACIKPGDPVGPAYDRLRELDFAVRAYFYVRFQPSSDNLVGNRPEVPASRNRSFEAFMLESVWMRGENDYLKGFPTDDPGARALYATIESDYHNLRLSMVHESLKSESPGFLGFGVKFGQTRDPCFGFLNLRKEIVEGIRAENLRWGGVDFGDRQSGDIMHFDLGSADVATTTDPNPEGLVFTKG